MMGGIQFWKVRLNCGRFFFYGERVLLWGTVIPKGFSIHGVSGETDQECELRIRLVVFSALVCRVIGLLKLVCFGAEDPVFASGSADGRNQ